MTSKFWAVVPAAGNGKRMGSGLPKQYLPLNGQTVIEYALNTLGGHPRLAGTLVVLHPADSHWQHVAGNLRHQPLAFMEGGDERCHSVLNGLKRLAQLAQPDDWVLVHDAARPCLRASDIDRLLDTLAEHPVGGLLGVPLLDTIKRTDASNQIVATVDRNNLWRALTPQMFRLGLLIAAIEDAIAHGCMITDEAAAMERLGHRPCMVMGAADNIKITVPSDLALAALFLQQQEQQA